MALWTIALFLVVEPVIGQVFEPLLYGHSTGLSPVAVILQPPSGPGSGGRSDSCCRPTLKSFIDSTGCCESCRRDHLTAELKINRGS
jgi:hypothetical protein